jgi:hypothetical protein
MRSLLLSSVLVATAACTVMVNGKPRRIGGGGDDATAAASGATAGGTTGQAGSPTKSNAPVIGSLGETIKLPAGFTGPLITPVVQLRVDDIRISDLGFSKCDPGGGAFTTAQAPFSFELAAEVTDMRLRVEGPKGYGLGGGAVVIFPGGEFVCDDTKNEIFQSKWPKGTYKVMLFAHSIGMSGALRFEVPAKTAAAVEKAKGALPTITAGADGATNPAWPVMRPSGVSAEAADIGMGCGQDKHARVTPLANLVVKRETAWYLSAHRQPVFAITPDEKCFEVGGERQLAAGTYQLWLTLPFEDPPPAAIELEIDDRNAALAFAPAETRAVGDLAEPMTIAGKVRAPEQSWSRSFWCNGMARQPDFYLTSDRPLQDVVLSILWSRKPQEVHVFGPIAAMKENHLVRCGEGNNGGGEHRFDVFEGTYAVWIGSARNDKPATGDAYHVLLRRSDAKIDPLTALAPIPTDLTLRERALKNHYPYFAGRGLPAWEAAFTRAPDQLFAFARTASKDDYNEVAAGEPLLIHWSTEDGKTSAYRFDGSSVQIDTRLVAIERPATVALPTKFTPKPAESVSQALDDSGPEDKKAVDAYEKTKKSYDDCWYKYMSKNDPTWGHSGNLYKISSSGRITNVSDEHGKRADKKCGASRVDSAGKKLMKALAKSREARYQAHLEAVRARFGL